MDKTGMPLEHGAPNVVIKKGKTKVCYKSTGNKAQITVVGCVNDMGNAIPPMGIYSAKNFNTDWYKYDVPGSAYALSPKGWIDHEHFKHWLTHLVKHAEATHPLLLLDGYSSHYPPDSIEYARKKSVCHLTQLRNVSCYRCSVRTVL